ncbi:MAG: hypothetical protein ACRDFS_02120 [Chloroflexota bacterium]
MPEVSYLAEAADEARRTATESLLGEIATSIRNQGYWEQVVEWRISTETKLRVEVETVRERRWYKVSVSCDADLTCHAPTLERALEFLGLFDRLTMDLFWTLGWPSWAAKNRPEPLPSETTP